ncbi:MAG: shikimate kinase [Actinomycetota bacterium]|nr:shikimate kinase [Actinomycetota bacterium]
MGADRESGSTLPIIALIGPSGAGKTEIGRRLAQRLGRPFLDTDRQIVSRAGRSISQIFADDSEEGFRKLEEQAVADAASTPGAVVACGGGVVLRPANVRALRSAGVVVYLMASPETAAARVDSAEGRPLLQGGPVIGRLSELIRERHPLYEAAAHHVVDAEAPPERVADEIASLVFTLDDGSVRSPG